jgi:hypothetical protein
MRNGLLASLLVSLLGCGGFQNAPLRDRDASDGAADLGAHDGGRVDGDAPAVPCDPPTPLAIHTRDLSPARVGEVYVFPLLPDGNPGVPLSWALSDGALPVGLHLDPLSGLITGRPSPGAEGLHPLRVDVSALQDADCWLPGRSDELVLEVLSSCEAVASACDAEEACVGGRCVLPAAPCAESMGTRLLVSPGKNERRGLYLARAARITENGRALDAASSHRGARLGVLDPLTGEEIQVSYRLPDDLLLPVAAEQTVDLAFYVDELGGSALSLRHPEGALIFFSYDGPLSGQPFLTICKSLGACPLHDLRSRFPDCPPFADPSGEYVNALLELATPLHSVLLPQGETAPLGDEGPLVHVAMARQYLEQATADAHTPYVWHSFLVQPRGACPSPLIDLDPGPDGATPGAVLLDGSRSAALGAEVVTYTWTVVPPKGGDGAFKSLSTEDDRRVLFPTLAPGEYVFGLSVTDSEGRQSCLEDRVVFHRP